MPVKRLIVSVMCDVCEVLDRVYQWLPWPLTKLACPRGLALWSSNLDEHWHTGVWEKPDPKEDR